MQKARVCWAMAGVAAFGACGGSVAAVRLEPEAPATLHVGEVAAVHLPPGHYMVGSAGSALRLLKQKQQRDATVYLYHAVAPGNQTFVETPRAPTPDGCVSCVTVHYFIEVIR